MLFACFFFFFQAEDGIRDYKVTGVQTCALPISGGQLIQPAAGATFLLLSVFGFLYAAGPAHGVLPVPALDDLGVDTLYRAAACNLVCGVLLLGGALVRKKD